MNCTLHNQVPATAYCRTCGKALCEECKRDVMGAIYCEPCIAARLQGAPGGMPIPPPPGVQSLPNPGVAAVLGLFIPGVGAWYNGQFAKGFIHVIIFTILIAATDIIPYFRILVALFPVYMCFEAYSTANARRLGQPAPDLLGLDQIFGQQVSQAVGQTSTTQTATATGSATQPVAPASAGTQPVAAFILVGLGMLFLLSNFHILPHIGRLFVPLVLIGLGTWIFYKRSTGRP